MKYNTQWDVINEGHQSISKFESLNTAYNSVFRSEALSPKTSECESQNPENSSKTFIFFVPLVIQEAKNRNRFGRKTDDVWTNPYDIPSSPKKEFHFHAGRKM